MITPSDLSGNILPAKSSISEAGKNIAKNGR
jgi:hypothetical protein